MWQGRPQGEECREAVSCTVYKASLQTTGSGGRIACTGIHKGVRGLALNKLAQRRQPAPSTTGQARRAGTASQELTPPPSQPKERRKVEDEEQAHNSGKRRRLREDVGAELCLRNGGRKGYGSLE